VFTDPKQLDIDHVVPLQFAHLAGGWRWTPEQRMNSQTTSRTITFARSKRPLTARRAKGITE
jgi:hypothetical protein